MARRGKFIVFEGIDGSGSTTQVKRVHQFLQSHDIKSHQTKEPTNYLIGGLINSWLTGDWSSSPRCLQLLFTADRAYHLEKEVIPMLEQGINVICDRYYYSTVAYGSLDIPDIEWLHEINKYFLKPDLVIYLRIGVQEAIERLHGDRNRLELFEKYEYLIKVAECYEDFISMFSYFVVVNGGQEQDKVFEDTMRALDENLGIK